MRGSYENHMRSYEPDEQTRAKKSKINWYELAPPRIQVWNWEVLRVGTHEHHMPDKANKQSENGTKFNKSGIEHTKSGVQVSLAFWPSDNFFTPDLIDKPLANPEKKKNREKYRWSMRSIAFYLNSPSSQPFITFPTPISVWRGDPLEYARTRSTNCSASDVKHG